MISNLDNLIISLQTNIEIAAHNTLLEAGQLGQEAARTTKLFKNNGPLRDATNFHPIDKFSGFVLADKSYAHWLEDGNDPGGGFIYPTKSKFLHFFVNGEEIFAKKVRAHGPLPFMSDAETKVETNIESIWEKNFDKAIR